MESNLPRNRKGQTEEEFLAAYHPGNYERPSVPADILLFTVDDMKDGTALVPDKELKLLLVKRRDHPFIYRWAIPGGFVDISESIEEAAYRELKEETNVENVYVEQLFTWGDVDRDPRMCVISVSYMALIPKNSVHPRAGDDAAETAWFTVRKNKLMDLSETKSAWMLSLESEDKQVKIAYHVTQEGNEVTLTPFDGCEEGLAFDHAKIVNLALDRIRNKVEYTTIAFHLIPEKFTLTQLQKVYETLLGKTLYKANFRKKIAPMVLKTEEYMDEARHRPSQYYRFNPGYKETYY